MSEEGRMPPRYGFDVNGYARQMHDGYWTPWHIAKDEITARRAAHEALLRRTQSLETALDQERADNERLRAFAQECEKESRLVNDFIDPVEMRHDMKRRGLIDINGDPTALLSGRGPKESPH